jgi:hypothetical protein
MAVGDRWVDADEAGTVSRDWVTGTRPASGQTAMVLRSTDRTFGADIETADLKMAGQAAGRRPQPQCGWAASSASNARAAPSKSSASMHFFSSR